MCAILEARVNADGASAPSDFKRFCLREVPLQLRGTSRSGLLATALSTFLGISRTGPLLGRFPLRVDVALLPFPESRARNSFFARPGFFVARDLHGSSRGMLQLVGWLESFGRPRRVALLALTFFREVSVT